MLTMLMDEDDDIPFTIISFMVAKGRTKNNPQAITKKIPKLILVAIKKVFRSITRNLFFKMQILGLTGLGSLPANLIT